MNNINEKIYSLNTHIAFLKNDIEKLKDTALKLENKIKEMEAKKEQLIKERNESKFEIVKGEEYYYIDFLSSGLNMVVQKDQYLGGFEKARVDQNNCFKTKERAKEVFDKIKLLLELERFKSIYCPNDFPDWENLEKHYYKVYFNHCKRKWENTFDFSNEDMTAVYFPTKEIAQKVCEVLNEKERDDV